MKKFNCWLIRILHWYLSFLICYLSVIDFATLMWVSNWSVTGMRSKNRLGDTSRVIAMLLYQWQQCHRCHPCYCTEKKCKHPWNPTIVTRMVRQFEEIFSLVDKPRKGRRSIEEKRSESVETAIRCIWFYVRQKNGCDDRNSKNFSSPNLTTLHAVGFVSYKLHLLQDQKL